MDLTHLQTLKNKIEHIKSEQAKCQGQQQQLDVQKKELMKQFQECGVTRDTLPETIKQLEKDIADAEKEIDLVLNSLEQKQGTQYGNTF